MLDSLDIDRLYENVLTADINTYNISEKAIQFGISCMAHVYGETVGLNSERSQIADYTDPAHRCAYLHKYAALHTSMVRDMLAEAIRENYGFFHRLVFSEHRFKLCSLGGGPGTDVIGAFSALHAAFGFFEASATVVDYMAEWSFSFASILKELGTGWYGAFGNNISYYLNWRYVGANLLKSFKPDVLEALSTASLVTMIKFTSAAACMDTRNMIRNIFTAMRPGAALLFIDNDGGGFHKLIEDTAIEFNFRPIFGPFRRENYLNNFFRKKRFGYLSCCKTTVTVHVLQKPFIHPYDNFPNTYADPYMPLPRKDFSNNFLLPCLQGSPPTPYIYFGQSPDENHNVMPAKSPLLPVPAQSPAFTSSPYTPSAPPYTYTDLGSDKNGNRLGYASAYDVNFSQDENVCREPGFIFSPVLEIPQRPSPLNANVQSRIATPLTNNIVNSPLNLSRSGIYTPDSRRGKRARGCFPLRISKFRHHISHKIKNVKAHARSLFKKKNAKNHPIFKL